MRNDQAKMQYGVLKMDMVQKSSIMNYHGGKDFAFIKITVTQPKYIAVAKRLLDQGIQVPGFNTQSFPTFESNLSFDMRFMIDFGVVGANWIELPANKYRIRSVDKHTSHAQLEVDV